MYSRTVTIRTIPDFGHPRTGGTALLLPTMTELFTIDLIAQHDPPPDSQLAGHGDACFSQPLLPQFAPIETPQLRIAACRVSASLIPQKAQQRITLFADPSEPPPSPAGTFLWNQPRVAGQRRDRSHSWMGHEQPEQLVSVPQGPKARRCSLGKIFKFLTFRALTL
ncbi:MAG TPA: hypothetical protein VJN92_04915 [Candidatus Acidoferrum sp.]|nr:hypothetical protein [Candidatus Acidoferrum sp.]